MNYYNFIKTIKTLSLNNGLVNEVGEGDIYEHLNSGEHKYPCVFLTVQNLTINGDIVTLNGTMFYVDRLLDNSVNKIEVQSNALTILSQIFAKIKEDTIININVNTYTPFEEKFTDLCAGQFATFTASFPNDIICSDGEYEIRTITLTANGLYDVTGYDKALVNVITKWGDIEGNITDQTDLINYIDSHSTPAEWGNITGNIENQTDLNDKLTDLDTRISDVEDAVSNIEPFTPSTIVPTTTNFVPDTDYTIHESLQRTANLFGGVQGEIDDINAKVPAQASSQNQLADKNFVNSTVATNAANFRGNWVTWNDVPTVANNYPEDYAGNKTPTNNDYMVVQDASAFYPQGEELTIDVNENENFRVNGSQWVLYWNYTSKSNPAVIMYQNIEIKTYRSYSEVYIFFNVPVTYNGTTYAAGTDVIHTSINTNATFKVYTVSNHLEGQWRFMYVGDWDTLGKSGWQAQYKVGSSFTAAQQAALDSNITAQKVATYDGYGTDITALQTDKVDKVYTANKIYGTNGQGQQTAVGLGKGLYFGDNNINVNAATIGQAGIAKLYNSMISTAQDGGITPYAVSRTLQSYQPLLANTGHIHISKNTSGGLSARFVDKERPIIVGRAIPCKTYDYFDNSGALTNAGKLAFSYLSGSRYLVSGNMLKIVCDSDGVADVIYETIRSNYPDVEIFRSDKNTPSSYTCLIRVKINSTKMPIVRMPFFDYETTTLTSYENVIIDIISDICEGTTNISGCVRWANKKSLNFDKTASPYVTVSQGIIQYNKPIHVYKPQSRTMMDNRYTNLVPPLNIVRALYNLPNYTQHSRMLCCDVNSNIDYQTLQGVNLWFALYRKFDIRILRKKIHKNLHTEGTATYSKSFIRPGGSSVSGYKLEALVCRMMHSGLWRIALKWKRNKRKISSQAIRLALRVDINELDTRLLYKCNLVS